jgi:hypothetical protein
MVHTIQALKTKISTVQNKRLSLPVSLRTARDELTYLLAKKTGESKPLINEPRLKEWEHWALIPNKFPYSAAFKTHHLLIPKRQITEVKLNMTERFELREILNELSEIYDCHMTNFSKKQSILNHYHIHMLVYKDDRKDTAF